MFVYEEARITRHLITVISEKTVWNGAHRQVVEPTRALLQGDGRKDRVKIINDTAREKWRGTAAKASFPET